MLLQRLHPARVISVEGGKEPRRDTTAINTKWNGSEMGITSSHRERERVRVCEHRKRDRGRDKVKD